MAPNRQITSSDGSVFIPEVQDTIKALANHTMGLAIDPSGTNELTFQIDIPNGFTEVPDGAQVTIKMPTTNTGAVEGRVTNTAVDTGSKPFVDESGNPFTGGELDAGTSYTFVFHGGDDNHFRLQSPRSVPDAQVEIGNITFAFIREFTTPGAHTWTAPFRCFIRAHVIGAGASGAFEIDGVATGGGAGGSSDIIIEVASGETLNLVVGEGGAPVSVDATNGNDGGTSSIAGTDINANNDDINIAANGGSGGQRIASGAVPGGVGGNASGGDHNWTGGSGSDNDTVGGSSGGGVGLGQDGVSAAANSGAGAGLRSNVTPPVADFNFVTLLPFQVIGNKGGNVAGAGDPFCGGGGPQGAVSNGGNGGTGAGGGGATAADRASGRGGDGLIIIEWTDNLDS